MRATSGAPARASRSAELGAFAPAAVDMLSLLIVGASSTRRLRRPGGGTLVYTPRGYAAAGRVPA